jgi:hypothetical protein
LVQIRRLMFNRRHYFFIENFEQSIGFNESVIICLTPFTALYMGVSSEIELSCNLSSQNEGGHCKTNLDERKDFLLDVSRFQFHQHFMSSFCAKILSPKNYKPKM